MNLAIWLERAARLWPERPALLNGDEVLCDYREFAGRAARLAAWLHGHCGLRGGDRIAVFHANAPEYLILLYAIWHAGAVAVPINAKLHPREAAWIAADAQASILFVEPEKCEILSATCQEHGCDPIILTPAEALAAAEAFPSDLAVASRCHDDLAWLFYTSGTTGRPKGVMLSHGNLQAMTLTYLADVDDCHASDTALYAAPLSHGAGMYNFVHVLRGARHSVPCSRGFDPAEIIALAPMLGGVHMFAAPTMVGRLLAQARERGYHGEGIRTIVYGGGPMYLAAIDDALAWFGDRFVQIYGQGECPMAITALPRAILADRSDARWAMRAASVGLAQSCVEVAVAGSDGQLLPTGEIGEVVVRGSPVMLGYWRNPEATSAALRDGWLWTCDTGTLSEDGFLTLKDRSRDLIISGGTNIYPREVEEALLSHPGVREVAVIGVPDPDWGENVVAFVVPTSGQGDASILDKHCRERIARFKRPKQYVFVTDLPKNNYGKVLKTELRMTYPEHNKEHIR